MEPPGQTDEDGVATAEPGSIIFEASDIPGLIEDPELNKSFFQACAVSPGAFDPRGASARGTCASTSTRTRDAEDILISSAHSPAGFRAYSLHM